MPTYNELTDHLVTTMNPQSQAPFDTEAYRNYKQLVDKEREQIDTNNITEYLYKLGFRIDQQLQRIIDKLDNILEEENESI